MRRSFRVRPPVPGRCEARRREAALAAICAEPHDEPSIAASSVGSGRAAAAIALAATLDDETDFSAGEAALLRELLQRLATAPTTAPR